MSWSSVILRALVPVAFVILLGVFAAPIDVTPASSDEERHPRRKCDYDNKLESVEQKGRFAHSNLPIGRKSTGRLVFILADLTRPTLSSAMG